MEQAETIEVLGMTLTRVTKAHTAAWTYGDNASEATTLMLFRYSESQWHALAARSLTGPAATVQIHAYGDTPEAAVLALRDTMRQLTPLREALGRDLAAMLDAGEVAA